MRVKFAFICALFGAFGLSSCGRAEAQVLSPRIAFRPKVKVSYYLVEGKNSKELKASMLERGPVGHEQSRFYAYTFWHMKIGHSRQQILPKIVRRSDLLCDVSVQMPYWRAYRESSVVLQKYWDKFISAMAAHESRHVGYAVRACRNLVRTKGKEPYLAVVSRRLKKRDRSYDLQSRHGLLEGVSLP